MSQIYQLIQQIKDTSGSKAKKSLLDNYNNYQFKKFLFYTYNPYFNYHVKDSFPSIKTEGEYELDKKYDVLYKVADALRTREISGNNALDTLKQLLGFFSKEDQQVIKLFFTKDLKIGLQAKSINEVFADLIPLIPYMRCSVLNEKTIKHINFPAYIQTKEDGEFINLICTKELIDKYHEGFEEYSELNTNNYILHRGYYIQAKTRQGNRKESIENKYKDTLVDICESINMNICIHGELLNKNTTNRMESNGALNRLNHDDIIDDIYVKAWDLLKYEDWANHSTNVVYKTRFEMLIDVTKDTDIEIVDYEIVNTLDEVYAFYRKIITAGGEGAVLKDFNLLYKFGDSQHQLKIKIKFNVDVEVIGYVEGTAGTKRENLFGSLLCKSRCGKLVTRVSGISDNKMKKINDDRDGYIGTIIEVEANDITPPVDNNPYYSLSHPRYKKDRNDKNQADSLEEIIEQLNAQITNGEII